MPPGMLAERTRLLSKMGVKRVFTARRSRQILGASEHPVPLCYHIDLLTLHRPPQSAHVTLIPSSHERVGPSGTLPLLVL